MADDPRVDARENAGRSGSFRAVLRALVRPYRVPLSMVLLMVMVPFYLLLADSAEGRKALVPELPLDRLFVFSPGWSLVYGGLYLFLIMLPVIVIQRQELLRRTMWAYLAVWTASYVVFFVFPTAALRPEPVPGAGFGAWGLRFLYGADPPYNCFPSLHVAHSFVSALACLRVHRRLGRLALLCAALVALSTLFIKQHYVADVAAGVVLALAAGAIFLRTVPASRPGEEEWRVAPGLALVVGGFVLLCTGGFWVAYALGVPPVR